MRNFASRQAVVYHGGDSGHHHFRPEGSGSESAFVENPVARWWANTQGQPREKSHEECVIDKSCEQRLQVYLVPCRTVYTFDDASSVFENVVEVEPTRRSGVVQRKTQRNEEGVAARRNFRAMMVAECLPLARATGPKTLHSGNCGT